MRKIKDLTGKKFGRLTAICPNGKNKQNATLWLCICECGSECQARIKTLKYQLNALRVS